MFVPQVGMDAFMEFFKVSPDATKSFSFFEQKQEAFYDLLSKHASRALGIVTNVVCEVIYKFMFYDNFVFLFILMKEKKIHCHH